MREVGCVKLQDDIVGGKHLFNSSTIITHTLTLSISLSSASTVVICHMTLTDIWCMRRHRVLKTEERKEGAESALKEVKWHYKDNPIRL